MDHCDVAVIQHDHTYSCISKRLSAFNTKMDTQRTSCPCCKDQHTRRKRKQSASSELAGVQRFSIPPALLPSVSPVPSNPQQQPSPELPDEPLRINSIPVEEYRRIYHKVVDDILRFKDGRQRLYSLDLGRHIKQILWERLNHPTFTTSEGEDGRLQIISTDGLRVTPPQFNVDVSDRCTDVHLGCLADKML